MAEVATPLDPALASPLKESLKQKILSEGPITFCEWMKAALYEPHVGYYMRSDRRRWGRKGDYRTSPERSELFAATFARYFETLYRQLGAPDAIDIVECGAGDGSFAFGVLATLRESYPQFFNVVQYVVNEQSESARGQILCRLADFEGKICFQPLQDLDAPAIVFSNELLDAFPVHRVQLVNGEFSELYVSVDDAGHFVWSNGELSSSRLSEFCRSFTSGLSEGQLFEVNLGIEDWIRDVATNIARGYVVTVDYGKEADDLFDFELRPTGTLRAYSQHRFVNDVLSGPGDYDITASVNWTHVKEVGDKCGLTLIAHQRLDQFLLNAGILEELERRMVSSTTQARQLELTTKGREMILPNGMAAAFQVLVQQIG